jgi:acetylornithine deacetylase
MKDVEQLLIDLVGIPSVSPMANAPVIDYVAACLNPEKWTIDRHSYMDAAGTPKVNLVARSGRAEGNHAELALVCHTDTVPFDAAWSEAVHPVLRDQKVYGRGSCDVKGFLACVLAAVDQSDIDSLDKPLAIVLTADEEVGCVGAKHLAATKAFSSRYMIIGEPTDMRPMRAGKGYGLGTITVLGKEAHSAFPAAGRSAIFHAARVVSGLELLARELESPGNPNFSPPFTTLNVGLIGGGTAKNIVPGECRLTVEWRPVPGEKPERVPELINQLLDRLAESTSGFEARFEVLRSDPAFVPSETHFIARMLAEMTGTEPSTIAFGSEAAHLRELTDETVVFGPGDMTVAHKTGEYVPARELHRCVDYLRSAITRVCAAGS